VLAGTKLLVLLPLWLVFYDGGHKTTGFVTAVADFLQLGTKLLGLLPLWLIFYGDGHKTAFFVTNQTPFSSSRAPRTFLGERYPSFFPFAGSKNLPWRPLRLFFSVCGLQEPSLATVTPLFLCSWAPRTFLGDRYPSFSPFAGSKNLPWRPLCPFFTVRGLQAY
jgi:hypothetical protein